MDIFSAGIVWDPREPLPPEYNMPTLPVPALRATDGPATTAAPLLYQPPPAPQVSVRTKPFPTTAVRELYRNVLPALSVTIEARVTGDIAEVTAKQLFWNDADIPIHQGSYTFALPNGCTVMGFTCRIGNGNKLKATARPKAEAQNKFQQALASRTTAALLEQNTPEIFTSSLGNIPPNTRVKTEITYATILQRMFSQDTNTTTLTIPTYIANRYGERPDSLQGLDLETKPDDISIRVEILESEQIQSVKSTSHEILIERGTETGQVFKWGHIGKGSEKSMRETAIVTMKEATNWIERDFIISIDTLPSGKNGNPEAWLEIHPSFENQAAMMVTVPPRILPNQNEISKIGEILFVVDRSGSMEDKMENLKSAMHFFLKGIPLGRTFNIWCFGSSYSSLWAKSRAYEEESLRIALNYVDTMFRADLGGTEILPALEAIIAARDPSLPCDIVILTDGQVWRLDDTLHLVSRSREASNGAIRFFSLGLGAHVSHALVEGIAKQGGGYSDVVLRAHTEGWEGRLLAILKAALTSHIQNLSLELGGLMALASPTNLHSLNPFQAHRIFLLLEQGMTPEDANIALTFISDGERSTINASIIRSDKLSTIIHKLSARALIDDFERGISSSTPYQSNTSPAIGCVGVDISHLAETLACRYTLPSKWTALLLLESDNEVLEREPHRNTISGITLSHIEDGPLQRQRGSQWEGGEEIGFRPDRHYRRHNHHHDSLFSDGIVRCPSLGKRRDRDGSGTNYCGPPVTRQARIPCCLAPYDPVHAKLKRASLRVTRRVKTDADREFIVTILRHQAFDGSVQNEVLRELPEVARDILRAVKEWLCEKTNLEDSVLDLVANTTLVVAILERDYKEYKDLWRMMQQKAHTYISLHVHLLNLKDELMEYSRERLAQPNRLVRLKCKATSWLIQLKCKLISSQPDSNTRRVRRYEGARDGYASSSDPVLINEAPIDD
ncbi:von Willebrand factor type A domain-containing protein [Xylaria sp. FL0043]|nr:von Willebrand factor type A domain-containing protein [Xylaria sp. FL0043]